MQGITPFLWFNDQAEEAAHFYVSVFKNSRIKDVVRYPAGAPGPEGSVMIVTFTLNGQEFVALNGGPQFTFSLAISFVVKCETQEEVDYYWEKLTEGGTPSECGWLQDKYGVSWQIWPTDLGEMLAKADAAQSARVMAAVLTMTKLDIETLRRAYDGA